jgi:hypothetical protein
MKKGDKKEEEERKIDATVEGYDWIVGDVVE